MKSSKSSQYALKSGSFDYTLDYKKIDFRQKPELYKVGKGEQGVLMVEPYKSEILPYWKFKTPEIARASADKIYELFLNYLEQEDFVGADMARKFIQMGFTRSRRYANHSSGHKYEQVDSQTLQSESSKTANIRPQEPDWATNLKAQSAKIFFEVLDQAKTNPRYIELKQEFLAKYK